MKTFLNELSLNGQYNEEDIEQYLRDIAEILLYLKSQGIQIYSSELLWERPVIRNINFNSCIFGKIRDNDLKKLILEQIVNGPFWESDRIHKHEDKYIYRGLQVNNYSIAEAAERTNISLESCALLSFSKSRNGIDKDKDFDVKICIVIKESNGYSKTLSIPVINILNNIDATNWYSSQYKSNNWKEFIQDIGEEMSNLRFLNRVRKTLSRIRHQNDIATLFREYLLSLNNIWYPLQFGNEISPSKDIIKIMEERGFEVSDESESTKNNKDLMKYRLFKLPDGRKEAFTLHLKIRCYRIYFFLDKKEKLIWIGHIGNHLGTSKWRH